MKFDCKRSYENVSQITDLAQIANHIHRFSVN